MPKAQFKITFTPKEFSLTGKTVAEVLASVNSKAEKGQEINAEHIRLMRDAEKGFLESCLQTAMQNNKKLSDYHCISVLSKEIEDAEDCFVIDEDDLKKYIVDMIEKFKEPLPIWTKLQSLFKQLKTPEAVVD